VVEQLRVCQRAWCYIAKMNFRQYQIKLLLDSSPAFNKIQGHLHFLEGDNYATIQVRFKTLGEKKMLQCIE